MALSAVLDADFQAHIRLGPIGLPHTEREKKAMNFRDAQTQLRTPITLGDPSTSEQIAAVRELFARHDAMDCAEMVGVG